MEVKKPDGTVRGVNAFGQRVAVPQAELDDFLLDGGRVATPEDLARYAKEKNDEALKARAQAMWDQQSTAAKVGTVASLINPVTHVVARAYGGTLPPEVESYIAGVDDTMTGGLAGGLLRQGADAAGAVLPGAKHGAGQQYHDTREGAVLSSPTANVLGKVAGVGGFIASSGSSLTARAGEEAASRVGAAIAADTAGARIASRAAQGAARFGVEGAILGAQHQIGENLLEDRAVGDKVFAAAGLGGVLGLAMGGTLGTAGGLFREGFRAGKDVVQTNARKAIAKALATEGAAAEEIAAEDLLLSNAERGTIKLRDEAALRSLQAKPGDLTKLTKRVAGGEKAVGRYVAEDIIGPRVAGIEDKVEIARRAAAIGTPDRMLEALAADKTARIQPIFEGAFDKLGNQTIKTSELREALAAQVKEMRRDPMSVLGADSVFKNVTHQLDALEASAGTEYLPTKELFRKVSQLRGAYQPTAHSAEKSGMKEFWDAVDDRIVDDITKAGAGKEILEAKRLYQLNKVATQMAEAGSKRLTGNNWLSLRSSFAANTGSIVGAGIGSAVAGPIGGFAGAAVGHLGAGAAWQYASNRGHAVAAGLLHRASVDGTVRKGVRFVEGVNEKAAEAVIKGERIAVETPKKPLAQRAKEALATTRRLTAQTAGGAFAAGRAAGVRGTVDSVNGNTDRLRQYSPALADDIAFRSAATAAKLKASTPPPDPRPFPPPDPRRMTDQEQLQLVRRTEYSEAPMRAIRDIANGRWSREALDTINAAAPETLKDLRFRMIRRLEMTKQRGDVPKYEAQRRVGEALGVPVVAEQRPEHAAFLQSLVVGPQEPQGTKPNPVGRPRKLDTKNTATFLDRESVLGRQRR